MNIEKILDKLKDDKHYYGEFGKKFLSNSDIQTLFSDPSKLKEPSENNVNFAVGGYFHTAILEPDKLDKFKILDFPNRNYKQYRELSGGEICLLQHEVDNIELMKEKLLANDTVASLILGEHEDSNIEYEVPNIIELGGNMWKGKADIVNHDEKLIIDLKTTSKLNDFRWSAKKYNYDSQSYIYSSMFGYDFLFIAMDKVTHQIGLFDCSANFYSSGEEKVIKANEIYDLFYKNKDFKHENFFINETL